MPDPGPWEPLTPAAVRTVLAGSGVRWWIAGGWSLDLLVGRQTRRHADIDVIVLRADAPVVRAHLAAWDLHVADPPGAGTLRPWPVGEQLEPELHDVWARRAPGQPWRFQIMLDEAEGEEWVYRRHPRVRRPVATLRGRASYPDMPVLAPEIQLLYKSQAAREKDEVDFTRVLPLLTEDERAWLRRALETVAPGHPWAARLGSRAARP
ncbi:MAG TPA: hypothetical protein VHS57_07345 [Acidimicrobiales bacterium]|nr:hypothetical protein [Acidimicrobiales bacterium]